MDMSQQAEVRALRGVLSRMDRGGKCIPCRIILFFSLIVFIGVVVFVFVERAREQSALRPVPQELAPQLNPEQKAQMLLDLEDTFKQQRSSPGDQPLVPSAHNPNQL